MPGRKWFCLRAAVPIASKPSNRRRAVRTRWCVADRNVRPGDATSTATEYADVVRDSRRKWRDAHPDNQKQNWQNHPEAAARNRQQQRQRDQKRRVSQLVKNTLVVDLKRSAAEVWLVGRLAEELVKNTLVPSKLLILQSPPTVTPL